MTISTQDTQVVSIIVSFITIYMVNIHLARVEGDETTVFAFSQNHLCLSLFSFSMANDTETSPSAFAFLPTFSFSWLSAYLTIGSYYGFIPPLGIFFTVGFLGQSLRERPKPMLL